MRSMTGYARATATVPAAAGGQDVREVCVEMRSVNNRYLDLSVRLPRSLTGLEERVRRALTAAGIARGKLDVTVTMTVRDASGEEGGATPLEPDMVFARRLADAAQRLSEGLGVPNDLTVSRLMAMPGVLVPVRPEAGESEEDAWGVLEPVLADAVAQFLDARAREGERLGADMLGKIARIRTLAAELAAASEEDVRTLRERLRSLIGQADVQPDEARIITECAVFADHISVDEELVRLSSHLDTLEGLLHTDDAVGRKIDFMLQETNREVNTVGSKCSNAGMARLVAEIKKGRNSMKFINIGYGNMVAVDRIVTLVSPDSAPIKRLIQDAKDDGRVIDVTCGRKTRAVIITDSEHVILSALQAETIANRLDSDADTDDAAEAGDADLTEDD